MDEKQIIIMKKIEDIILNLVIEHSPYKKIILGGLQMVDEKSGLKMICEICGSGFEWRLGFNLPIHNFCYDCMIKLNKLHIRMPVIVEKCCICGKDLGLGEDRFPHCPKCNMECEYCSETERIEQHKLKIPNNIIEFDRICREILEEVEK